MHNKFQTINLIGTYNLYLREVKRFLKVYHQTLINPAINAMMFLATFVLTIGSVKTEINGIKFINFMGYGLIIMTIIQNAFANSSSSLTMSKVIGYIIDIFMPPLSSKEIIIAYSLGALTRALITGTVVALVLTPFIEYKFYHPFLMLFFIVCASLLLAQLGIFAGIVARSFEEYSIVTNYIITPLSFLSGTFYSIQQLPLWIRKLNLINPFFYMIDGFRYSFTNVADSNITIGMIYLVFTNILLFFILDYLINKGWRIKS